MYTHPLSLVINESGVLYHFFADDSQLHDSTMPAQFPSLLGRVQTCIENVGQWMMANKLQMNDSKTEMIKIGTKHKMQQISACSATIFDCTLSFASSVRNLGVLFDETLTMEAHINQLCRTLNYHLRRIAKIRYFLTVDAAKKLAVSFILSRLDYCNSLLAGLPDDKLHRLQVIQNNAARLILHKSKHDRAKPLLKALHWLPVKARIDFKVACMCFRCLNDEDAPSYLSELVQPYTPARTLRSGDSLLLVEPRFSLSTFGKRSFSVFGPSVWNNLPLSLRKQQSYATFRKHLKTYLFQTYLTAE
jgi:hypothetical protein